MEVDEVRKTHLAVLGVVLAAILLAIGAVGAYADLASDVTAPTTTTDVAASYWDSAAITATATDDEGIAYIYHELDEGIARLATIADGPLSAQISIPTAMDSPLAPGPHKLKFWAQDINGNVEAQQTVTFEIVEDTVKPTTSAWAVAALRGRVATLKYRVNDPEPTKGTAAVSIKIKNRAGKVVKTLSAGTKSVNAPLTKKFRCGLAKGTYRYYVYATDASGNAQSKIGSARLTVK
jgi:hypothetical protein